MRGEIKVTTPAGIIFQANIWEMFLMMVMAGDIRPAALPKDTHVYVDDTEIEMPEGMRGNR